MSQRDEALGSVLEAARALQRDGVSGPGLVRLFAAVDAVSDVEATATDADPISLRGPVGIEGEDHFGRCADRGCWCWTGAVPVDTEHARIRAERAAAAPDDDFRTADSGVGPTDRLNLAFAPDLPTCAAMGCWRAADLPGGLCHHCSEAGQAPLPFERARRRDPARGGGADG